MDRKTIIWFDGDCPLCRREIGLVRRLDWLGRLELIDVAAGAPADCPIDHGELLARFHARTPEGQLVSGAAAFAAMWRAVPLLMPFGHMMRVPLILSGMEWLYLRYLRIRPRLQALARRGKHA